MGLRAALPGLLLSLVPLVALVACSHSSSSSQEPSTFLSDDDLKDPNTCKSCHADHYAAWSGSMHAYASDDPVFVAMNARAQRETNGAIGDFCTKCHVPVAGTKGVTCYACHAASAVKALHDNQLTLATDRTMRGGIADPAPNQAHAMLYSTLHDRERLESSDLCGSCHDVENQNGFDAERTYAEWKGSLFAHADPKVELSCGSCHMPGKDGTAAQTTGAPMRRVHDHSMAGLDVALTPFPGSDAQKQLVQASLDGALSAKLCVQTGGAVTASLEATFVGHGWPSGASQDRRAWVEIVGYAGGQMVFQSGVVADGQPVPLTDASLFLLRERIFDAQKNEVKMLWQAASSDPAQLAVAVTGNPTDPMFDRSMTNSYSLPANVDRVTMRARVQPIGLDVLDDLIASHDLDPGVRAKMPTFTLASTTLEWKTASGFGCVP